MRVIGTIRPTEIKRIEVEVSSYESGLRQVAAEVPEGWELIAVRADRDAK